MYQASDKIMIKPKPKPAHTHLWCCEFYLYYASELSGCPCTAFFSTLSEVRDLQRILNECKMNSQLRKKINSCEICGKVSRSTSTGTWFLVTSQVPFLRLQEVWTRFISNSIYWRFPDSSLCGKTYILFSLIQTRAFFYLLQESSCDLTKVFDQLE